MEYRQYAQKVNLGVNAGELVMRPRKGQSH